MTVRGLRGVLVGDAASCAICPGPFTEEVKPLQSAALIVLQAEAATEGQRPERRVATRHAMACPGRLTSSWISPASAKHNSRTTRHALPESQDRSASSLRARLPLAAAGRASGRPGPARPSAWRSAHWSGRGPFHPERPIHLDVHSSFMAVFAQPHGARTTRRCGRRGGGAADDRGIEGREHLAPEAVDRAAALIHHAPSKELRRNRGAAGNRLGAAGQGGGVPVEGRCLLQLGFACRLPLRREDSGWIVVSTTLFTASMRFLLRFTTVQGSRHGRPSSGLLQAWNSWNVRRFRWRSTTDGTRLAPPSWISLQSPGITGHVLPPPVRSAWHRLRALGAGSGSGRKTISAPLHASEIQTPAAWGTRPPLASRLAGSTRERPLMRSGLGSPRI